jgi:HTH-type transcriptional regulator/antitoxin HigA
MQMIQLITSEEQYEDALSRIYDLMQADLATNSPEDDELDLLATIVKEYELIHHPIPAPVR